MNNLDFIAKLCKDHLYNPNCKHFGGANLIITDHGPATNEFGDSIAKICHVGHNSSAASNY